MWTGMQTILVVDNDERFRARLGFVLAQEGFAPVLTGDGRTGFETARVLQPQLILSELRLPGLSALELCQQLHAEGIWTPLIVLSAATGERDKILLLETGADDYVVKPCGQRELAARIRAVLRRTSPVHKAVRFGAVEVDLDHRRTTCHGVEIPLTLSECQLLLFLLHHPDRLVTSEQICTAVWGHEADPSTRRVDPLLAGLRQKLEPDPQFPRHFVRVPGVGYRFRPEPLSQDVFN
jgi:DNA-binding response OmpR family regulator